MNICSVKSKGINKNHTRICCLLSKNFFVKTIKLLFFLLIFFKPSFAQFNFDQFRISDLADFQLVKNATLEGNRIRLTLNAGNQVGACWYKTKQQVDEGFETEFIFQITDIGGWWGGGDGFAFVVQNYAMDAIGGIGGEIGYGGIPNSLAIEFDTWNNYGDPNNNHISIQTKGTEPNESDKSASIGYTTEISNLSDGEIHRIKITYQPPLIEIYMDSLNSTPVLSVNINLADSLQLDDGRAWIGFTAATGSAYEKHYILSWKFGTTNSVGIPDEIQNALPEQFSLYQNFPNPFNPATTISYALPKSGHIELTIYNLLGQKVRTLVNTYQPAGQFQVQWDGRDAQGNPVASGVYVYKLKAKSVPGERFEEVRKMILMR